MSAVDGGTRHLISSVPSEPVVQIDALTLLRALDEGVASKTGAAFFPHLVQSLAQTLSATCVFVSEIDLAVYRANVLSIWHRGEFAAPFSYSLRGTPCECVLENRIIAFPRRVQDLFPEDREGLAHYEAESFLAIPLCDEHNQVRGHIAVLDSRERDWGEADMGILRIFSSRAGAELARRDYERRLEAVNSALQEANDQLRQELEQRLEAEHRLAEAQRAEEQARRAAERASQAKSNFLAHMSHELRTPLNGILGYAQLLRRDATLRQEQLEGVSVIESSGEHLLTLINDLLDLSKIEAGRLDLRVQHFNLPELLKQVADIAEVRARQAGLAFALQLMPDLPTFARGDERALRQVLLNLLGNAVKFTPNGSVTLRALASDEAADRHLVVTVEDTGPGIATEELPRIFEPFERAGAEPRIEGAGLGLSISKRIVDAMGGKLEVTSIPGRGSRFTLRVRLDLSEPAALQTGTEPQISGYEGPRRRVLVVDDDVGNRQVLSRLLASVGLIPISVPDAAEALQRLIYEPVDLLATDLAMPGMTGLALAQRVRADERLHGLPIVAVSASASAFTRDEAIAAGCDAFVAKPVHADELFETLGRLLRIRWTTIERPAAESEQQQDMQAVRADPAWTQVLLDLAMKGDVKELIERAAAACSSDPAAQPLYREVQRLGRRFDLRGVRRALQLASGSDP
jgi:signal transduction histidine kinase/DNA-binding response OmpR family regulator